MSAVSLLWSPGDQPMPLTDTAFVCDLHLDELIRLRGERVGELSIHLSAFMTCHSATMEARNDLFLELLDTPGLYDALQESFDRLSSIYALQAARDGAMSEEQLLYSIREIEDYLAYLGGIKAIFAEYTVRSPLLRSLWQAVEPLCTGEDYDTLCQAAAHQSHAIHHIKSITVGVNLDPALRPVEAGVIGISEQSFVSGEPLSHLLRLQFSKDDFTCMAPLCPTSRRLTPQEQGAMRESVHTALRKIFGDSLKSWALMIKKHVIGNLGMLVPLIEEWRFITAVMDTLLCLRRNGFALCRPHILDRNDRSDSEIIHGLYHPLLAMTADRPDRIVRNALTFDSDGRFYILTGPNSGGKSVYLEAVGLAYAMLHLGLPLPAESATICPTDGILTHFVDTCELTAGHGRLGAECARLHEIHRAVTKDSLLLFDEALSGTNATEATAISSECLAAYADIGARGIWVTHLHDLCRLPEILGPTTPSRLANLSAQLEETSHDRLFMIVRTSGTPHSYALDIARSFHLTREEIVARADCL